MKPLPFLPALAIFLGLGVWVRMTIYSVIPFLNDQGMHQFSAYLSGFILGLLPLLPLAFLMLKREGTPLGGALLPRRLCFRRFGARQVALMLGLTVLAFAATVVASPTQSWIVSLSPLFQPGEVFHPIQIPGSATGSLTDSSAAWMGPQAVGYWPWAVAILVLFLLNIVGEEILWRGVIWPRQELVYGDRTWLVHGFLWYLFHLPFYPWFLISGLPQAFALSYLFQKTRNMWFYAVLLMIVLGVFA